MKHKQDVSSLPMLGCFILISGIICSNTISIAATQHDVEPHECVRRCSSPAEPKTCRYTFVVETYATMAEPCIRNCAHTEPGGHCDPTGTAECVTADAYPRMVTVVNRSMPGPTIEVCKGDRIVVDMINHMMNGEGVTIHFHGVYQEGTPHMDGAAMITQCPIAPGATFRYNFTANPSGTHWWHSHDGLQRGDGFYGLCIINEPPEEDQQSGLYDTDYPEHRLLVVDWGHVPSQNFFTRTLELGPDYYREPDVTIINGIGQTTHDNPYTPPYIVFHVQQGKRHRFRIVNGDFTDSPTRITVDEHKLTMIASDGRPFHPITVDTIVVYSGERYDIILEANQKIDNYWLQCIGVQNSTIYSAYAIVRYAGAPAEDPFPAPVPAQSNLTYQKYMAEASEEDITVNELINLENATLPQENVYRVYLAFDIITVDMHDTWFHNFDFTMNDRLFANPPSPPLSQLDQAAGRFCPIDVTPERCATTLCTCTLLLEAELNQTVEIVLIDLSNSTVINTEHTFHLHGYSFYVLDSQKVGFVTTKERIMKMDQDGEIKRNFDRPPQKDTVVVPSAGYTVIQFVADNPGWWYFHCHFDPHQETGMAMVIRVGNQTDLPPIPTNFPKCGNFLETNQLSSPTSDYEYMMYFTVSILAVVVVFLAIVIIVQFIIVRSPWRWIYY